MQHIIGGRGVVAFGVLALGSWLPGQEKTIEVDRAVIVVTDEALTDFGKHVAEVVKITAAGLKELDLELPKGLRITLLTRWQFEAWTKGRSRKPIGNVYADFSQLSNWIPVLHVNAETTAPEAVRDQLSDTIAGSLGALVVGAVKKGSVPAAFSLGLGGYTQNHFRMSPLRRHGKAIALQEVPELHEQIQRIANRDPRLPPHTILEQAPLTPEEQDAATEFFDVLVYERPVAVRLAVAQRMIALARDIGVHPTDQQVARMEKDLVEAIGLTATTIKAMKLEERMEQLGIDKKKRKEPVALLRSFHDVQLTRLAAACAAAQAASAKPAAPADKE